MKLQHSSTGTHTLLMMVTVGISMSMFMLIGITPVHAQNQGMGIGRGSVTLGSNVNANNIDMDPSKPKKKHKFGSSFFAAAATPDLTNTDHDNNSHGDQQHEEEDGDEKDDALVIEEKDENDPQFSTSAEVAFEGITILLQQKNKKNKNKDANPPRKILDGSLKGVAKPGRMLAIMGPSGSGKSSLVHAIAGRIKDSKHIIVKGKRYINNEPLTGDSSLPAAIIEQDVNFFPHMTVQETLDFRVELKLGSKLGKSARDDIVQELMEMLGLTKSKDTIVGNAKVRGLSGGERKRLSIACELISAPPVMILDEPVS